MDWSPFVRIEVTGEAYSNVIQEIKPHLKPTLCRIKDRNLHSSSTKIHVTSLVIIKIIGVFQVIEQIV